MRWIILLMASTLAFADGTTPKPSPTDYEVHADAGPYELGAEYMVHSFSAGEEMYLAERYLVVEVALYPPLKTDPVKVDMTKFGLRINHKMTIPADDPSHAAASLTPSPFDTPQSGPHLSVGGGLGPIIVGSGQPRYPNAGPKQPRAPEAGSPGGIERRRTSPEEVLLSTALPAGPHQGPVSGFVYFPYNGKTKRVKSVELIYDSTVIKLK